MVCGKGDILSQVGQRATSFHKPKTYRSKKFLQFVRTLPCCVNNAQCMGDIIYHHTSIGGTALKGPDLESIPLCHYHHDEHDRLGKVSFYKKYLLDRWMVAAKTMASYIESIGG